MRKFIMLNHEPWTMNDQETFYSQFEKAHIKVEVWDLHRIQHDSSSEANVICLPEGGRIISTYKELMNQLNLEIKNNIAVIECIPRDWRNRKIFKFLSENNIPMIRIECYGNTPTVSNWKFKLQRISFKNLGALLNKKIIYILTRMYYKTNHIKPRDFIFSSNSFNRTIAYNHPDYEKWKFDSATRIIDKDYLVFSDVYFPLHPDISYYYKKYITNNNISPAMYYKKMNKLFDTVEKQTGLPVIIAAHPKSNYNGDEFNGRQIIKYHTNNLVRYSSGIILHYSCTLSYAALCNKPVLFVDIEEFDKIPYLKGIVKSLAKNMGLACCHIKNEKVEGNIYLEEIPCDIRYNYIYNYLTSKETENIPNHITLNKTLSLI